jgi:hypothetical protein
MFAALVFSLWVLFSNRNAFLYLGFSRDRDHWDNGRNGCDKPSYHIESPFFGIGLKSRKSRFVTNFDLALSVTLNIL